MFAQPLETFLEKIENPLTLRKMTATSLLSASIFLLC